MSTTPEWRRISIPGRTGIGWRRTSHSTIDLPPTRHLGHTAVALHATHELPTALVGFAAGADGCTQTTSFGRREEPDDRARELCNYVGVVWQNAVVTPAAVSELRRAVVARLGDETTDEAGVRAAGILLARLLAAFTDHAPGPLFVSIVWGWSFPVITITLRGPHEGEPDVRGADGLVSELTRELDDPIVREHRVIAKPSIGVRAVAVLDLVRRL
jgi:hypothetical protein